MMLSTRIEREALTPKTAIPFGMAVFGFRSFEINVKNVDVLIKLYLSFAGITKQVESEKLTFIFLVFANDISLGNFTALNKLC